MPKIFTPSNQIQLANLSVVRMKKGGMRFEIVCYQHKVAAWRDNIEKDIDEVLQTHTVFNNVSKGQAAKKEELQRIFSLDDTEICKLILAKGELQITDKERQTQQANMFKDIACRLSGKCVNPETQRPYPVSIIEQSMRDIHFVIKPNRNVKQNVLEAIPLLKAYIPLEKAKMRIRMHMNGKDAKKYRERVLTMASLVESETWTDGSLVLQFLVDPGHFRELNDIAETESKGQVQVELINIKAIQEGDKLIE